MGTPFDRKLSPKIFTIEEEIPEGIYRMKDFIVSHVRGKMDNMDADADKESRTPLGSMNSSSVHNNNAKTIAKIKVTESSLCNLILPAFTFLRWVTFCHDKFQYQKYEQIEGSVDDVPGNRNGIGVIRHVKGSLFRKIFGCVVQILIIVHIVGFTRVMQLGMVGQVKTMFKIILVAYISFNLAGYRVSWFKFLDISMIFNSIQQLEKEFCLVGGKFPKPQKVKTVGWILVGLYFTISIAFTCVNRFTIGNWLENGFYHFLQHLSSTAVLELNLLLDLHVEFNATQTSPLVNSAIALPFVLLGFLYEFTWIFGFLLNFLWGIVFSWIFKVFFELISAREKTPENTLEDIRKFNEITLVIESFNDVFSANMLTAVLSGSIHFSVYVLTLFTTEDQGGLLPIMTALSFSLFWIQLFACAHVNHYAQMIGTTLKKCYQNVYVKRDRISNGLLIETMQGMNVIYYELLAYKIGFQGCGFFTVTYSFIGTVVSMIATYSLVVMQFKDSP